MKNKEINKIVELDLRKKERRKLKVEELAREKAKEALEESYGELGLEIEIKSLKNPEKFVEEFYKWDGWQVGNINASYGAGRNIPSCLKDHIRSLAKEKKPENEYSEIGNIYSTGCPDMLMWKCENEKAEKLGPQDMSDISEYYFVEAKHSNDGLRPSQVSWIHDKFWFLPVKICMTKKAIEER